MCRDVRCGAVLCCDAMCGAAVSQIEHAQYRADSPTAPFPALGRDLLPFRPHSQPGLMSLAQKEICIGTSRYLRR